MPGRIRVVIVAKIVVMDAMTEMTVAAATSGIGAMAVSMTIMGATAAATARGAMAATIADVGSMTAAAAATTVATATNTMVTAAAMAMGATAATTANLVSRRGAAAFIDASDAGHAATTAALAVSDDTDSARRTCHAWSFLYGVGAALACVGGEQLTFSRLDRLVVPLPGS